MAVENNERLHTKMLRNAAQKAACGSRKKGWGSNWNAEAQQNETEQMMHLLPIKYAARLCPQAASRKYTSRSSQNWIKRHHSMYSHRRLGTLPYVMSKNERSMLNTCSTPAGAQASARASPRSMATRGTCKRCIENKCRTSHLDHHRYCCHNRQRKGWVWNKPYHSIQWRRRQRSERRVQHTGVKRTWKTKDNF